MGKKIKAFKLASKFEKTKKAVKVKFRLSVRKSPIKAKNKLKINLKVNNIITLADLICQAPKL